jgi:multiple sugar transport system substrate-binding protein
MPKKSVWIGVAAIVVVAVVLWRHGTGHRESSQVEIRIVGEASSNLLAIESLVPQFTQKTGIKVNVEAADFDSAKTRSDTDLSQGTGRYDIVLQYNFALSQYITRGYVDTLRELNPWKPVDLNWKFEGSLFENVWREVGFYYMRPYTTASRSEAVAYPFSANTMLLVLNRKLYEDPALQAEYLLKFHQQLAAPSTWAEYVQQAAFFTRPEKGLSGVVLQGASGSWVYYEFMNFLFGNGGKTMQKPYGWASDLTTPLELNSPEAAQAAAMYLSLKPYNAGGFLNVSATEQRAIMKQGHVAMALMWSDYIYEMIHREDGSWSTDYLFAPVPGERSMIAGGSFYINRKSRHKVEALRFVNFMLQEDAQAKMISRGLLSPLRSAYQESAVRNIPYANALLTSLTRATYMLEAGKDADLISDEVTRALQEAWRTDGSGHGAMHDAQAAIAQKRAAMSAD